MCKSSMKSKITLKIIKNMLRKSRAWYGNKFSIIIEIVTHHNIKQVVFNVA